MGVPRCLAQSLRFNLRFLSFSSQTKEGEPETGRFQERRTREWKVSWCAQEGLNLKGRGPRVEGGRRDKETGLWSEVEIGRTLEVANRPRERKEDWTRKRSSLAAM